MARRRILHKLLIKMHADSDDDYLSLCSNHDEYAFDSDEDFYVPLLPIKPTKPGCRNNTHFLPIGLKSSPFSDQTGTKCGEQTKDINVFKENPNSKKVEQRQENLDHSAAKIMALSTTTTTTTSTINKNNPSCSGSFSCYFCPELGFRSEQDVHNHNLSSHPEIVAKYSYNRRKCRTCKASFKSKSLSFRGLIAHVVEKRCRQSKLQQQIVMKKSYEESKRTVILKKRKTFEEVICPEVSEPKKKKITLHEEPASVVKVPTCKDSQVKTIQKQLDSRGLPEIKGKKETDTNLQKSVLLNEKISRQELQMQKETETNQVLKTFDENPEKALGSRRNKNNSNNFSKKCENQSNIDSTVNRSLKQNREILANNKVNNSLENKNTRGDPVSEIKKTVQVKTNPIMNEKPGNCPLRFNRLLLKSLDGTAKKSSNFQKNSLESKYLEVEPKNPQTGVRDSVIKKSFTSKSESSKNLVKESDKTLNNSTVGILKDFKPPAKNILSKDKTSKIFINRGENKKGLESTKDKKGNLLTALGLVPVDSKDSNSAPLKPKLEAGLINENILVVEVEDIFEAGKTSRSSLSGCNRDFGKLANCCLSFLCRRNNKNVKVFCKTCRINGESFNTTGRNPSSSSTSKTPTPCISNVPKTFDSSTSLECISKNKNLKLPQRKSGITLNSPSSSAKLPQRKFGVTLNTLTSRAKKDVQIKKRSSSRSNTRSPKHKMAKHSSERVIHTILSTRRASARKANEVNCPHLMLQAAKLKNRWDNRSKGPDNKPSESPSRMVITQENEKGGFIISIKKSYWNLAKRQYSND